MALWEAEDLARWAALEGADPRDGEVAALVDAGFAVAPGVDELAVLERHYRAARFDAGRMTLTIAPTLACNFGCDYCFQGAEKPAASMGQEVQDALVGFVQAALPGLRRIHVAWYGGEPLLRPQLVAAISDRLIAACDAAGVVYDAMIVTNGWLLDGAQAEALVARRVKSAQVTVDGLAVHDERRVLLSGGATLARIEQNLVEVVTGTPLGVNVRVNVDRRNVGELDALLERFVALGLARRPNFAVGFAPVEAITPGCHGVTGHTMGKEEYAAAEARLGRRAWELGLCPLPYPPRFRGICGAVKPKGLVVLPDGGIHKCWDTVNLPGHAVGSVFDPEGFARGGAAARWLAWTPFGEGACRQCRLLPSCAGSCAYKFLHEEHTRGEAARLPCPSWKYNLNERLVQRAVAQGVISAEDFDPLTGATRPEALCVPTPGEEAA
jgi:uncharacterized protein